MARKWQGMNWIRRDRRLAIHIRDGFRCLWCRKDLRDAEPGDLTLDHFKPVARGGHNNDRNLVTACRSCNSSRQDREPVAFLERLLEGDAVLVMERLREVHNARRRKLNRPLARDLLAERRAQPTLNEGAGA